MFRRTAPSPSAPPPDPAASSSSTTASTSRPHSTRTSTPRSPSLRVPSSIRRPSARTAPNAHVSLVFAPPHLSHGGQPSRAGTLAAEDRLSQQLDEDLGGRSMGLRSRRSSSATTASAMSVSGSAEGSSGARGSLNRGIAAGSRGRGMRGGRSGSHSGRESVQEEYEGEGELGTTPRMNRTITTGGLHVYDAGPSTSSRTSDAAGSHVSPEANALADNVSLRGTIRRANPKESSSWLRWNSPAPSFPKSRSRASSVMDKGKSREVLRDENADEELEGVAGIGASADTAIDRSALEVSNRGAGGSDAATLSSPGHTRITGKEDVLHSADSSPADDTQLLAPPSNDPPITPRRSWWYRAASPAPARMNTAATPTPKPNRLPPPTSSLVAQPAPPAASSLQPSKTSVDDTTLAAENLQSPAPPRVPHPTPAKPDVAPTTAGAPALSSPAQPTGVAQRAGGVSGWRAYLWGTTPASNAEAPFTGVSTRAENEVGASTNPSTEEAKAESAVSAAETSRPAELKNAGGINPRREPLDDIVVADGQRKPSPASTSAAPPPAPPPVTPVFAANPGASDPSSVASAAPGAAPAPAPNTKPGWGGYLTSFVYTPTPATASALPPPATPMQTPTIPSSTALPLETDTATIQAATADTNAPPELAPPSASARPMEPVDRPDAPTKAEPPPQRTPARNDTRDPPVPRKLSAASTTAGWLGYLTYRSTRTAPKRLAAGAFGPPDGEEVMDFSNDPNFPAEDGEVEAGTGSNVTVPAAKGAVGSSEKKAERTEKASSVKSGITARIATPVPQAGTATPTAARSSEDIERDKHSMPPPRTIPTKSSNLSIRGGTSGKRLSVSSTRSGGTITPLSSSPRTTTVFTDGIKPVPLPASNPPSATASPKPAAGMAPSALPGQPQPPASQPNLIIPSFETTFGRPPRSLLPLPPAATSGEGSKVAAAGSATGGLAWRALSLAGTYVYGASAPTAGQEGKGKGKEKGGQKSSGKGAGAGEDAVDAPVKEETRGMKEGRGVGADLPRRFGLDGEDGDQGWKGVKRVVVVGVHGWFPAKMLNSVIGEPTGTSQKFANMMGAAVKRFFDEREVEDIRLTLMPLEGEGTIDSRVDKLYKAYLSNPAWINDLRRADAVFFAAHSQGCIVTTHLLSRMIAQGHIRTPLNSDAVARCEWAFGPIGVVPPDTYRRGGYRSGAVHSSSLSPSSPPHGTLTGIAGSDGGYQRVCMLAMCGVHLGPLYSISTSSVIQPYLQWFENAAARELFEFQESTSAVSQAYQKALGMVLENEVRVVLLASLNDQVVPIYGASYSTATHPLLLRALFVDGASYSQTDFMTNLLCFAFMLRNAGLDDQNLIEHLSEATAGSLTGLGHSTPYEEPSTYSLAVSYLFLSGPARHPLPPLDIQHFSAREARNDFEIPWIMRALVDSAEVKDLFPGELKEMREGIVAWRPVTKALREMKRKLEPMAGRQSKLRPLPNSPSSASVNTLGEPHSVGSTAGVKGNSTLAAGLKRDW